MLSIYKIYEQIVFKHQGKEIDSNSFKDYANRHNIQKPQELKKGAKYESNKNFVKVTVTLVRPEIGKVYVKFNDHSSLIKNLSRAESKKMFNQTKTFDIDTFLSAFHILKDDKPYKEMKFGVLSQWVIWVFKKKFVDGKRIEYWSDLWPKGNKEVYNKVFPKVQRLIADEIIKVGDIKRDAAKVEVDWTQFRNKFPEEYAAAKH